jgi:uncharacterized membrane protein
MILEPMALPPWRFSMMQAHILPVVPLAAAFLARGFGD